MENIPTSLSLATAGDNESDAMSDILYNLVKTISTSKDKILDGNFQWQPSVQNESYPISLNENL